MGCGMFACMCFTGLKSRACFLLPSSKFNVKGWTMAGHRDPGPKQSMHSLHTFPIAGPDLCSQLLSLPKEYIFRLSGKICQFPWIGFCHSRHLSDKETWKTKRGVDWSLYKYFIFYMWYNINTFFFSVNTSHNTQ